MKSSPLIGRLVVAIVIAILIWIFLSPVNVLLAGVLATVALIVITFKMDFDPRF